MATTTYTSTGAKATVAAKLNKDIFAVEIKNHELLKQAYTAYLANSRQNLAVTKTRGQVVGSTIKPWKQKGTGRARFGSRYNPIWRGGGIVFGPTGDENYSKQLNTKAKRKAIRQALSLAAAANKLIVIEDIAIKEGKTAELVKLLTKIDARRNILLVVSEKTPELLRASRNLADVNLVGSTYINVFDILNADTVIFSSAALDKSTAWLKEDK